MLTDLLYKCDSTGKIRTYQIQIVGDKYKMITGTKDGKKVESKWTVCTAKNVGRSNEINAIDQAKIEAQARIDKKLVSNYYKTEAECIANPEQFFGPMLATKREDIKGGLKFPLILDPKLDGMRLVTGATFYLSRKGKEVPAARWIHEELEPFFEQYPNIILDGELYTHDLKDDFNTLMSLARREKMNPQQEAMAESMLQYHIYDIFDEDNPTMEAMDRKLLLDRIIPTSNRIRKVFWSIVVNESELIKDNGLHVANGYEGSIARTYNAPYENKRSKHLIKIKQFITEEFPIVDILEGTGNRSGIAGTVVINTGDYFTNGVRVGCGIKGSWTYAKELLDNKDALIGKQATIRHFGKTPDGSLRFPICIDIDRPD